MRRIGRNWLISFPSTSAIRYVLDWYSQMFRPCINVLDGNEEVLGLSPSHRLKIASIPYKQIEVCICFRWVK